MIGGILSGIGSLVNAGAGIAANIQNQKNTDQQMAFAQAEADRNQQNYETQLQTRVKDAQAAGLNPLAALGGGDMSSIVSAPMGQQQSANWGESFAQSMDTINHELTEKAKNKETNETHYDVAIADNITKAAIAANQQVIDKQNADTKEKELGLQTKKIDQEIKESEQNIEESKERVKQNWAELSLAEKNQVFQQDMQTKYLDLETKMNQSDREKNARWCEYYHRLTINEIHRCDVLVAEGCAAYETVKKQLEILDKQIKAYDSRMSKDNFEKVIMTVNAITEGFRNVGVGIGGMGGIPSGGTNAIGFMN